MTFSIIGTGNIAWFFGARLVAARHKCKGVYGRNIEEVKRLAEGLLAEQYGPIERADSVNADICFLAVSDAAIDEIAGKLSFGETVLVHTAGAVPIDVLQPATKDSAVLWPVYSILKNNPPGHRNIPCAWEAATAKAARYVQETGHAITDVLFEAKYEQRKWLHLSAVMGNNFVNHLLTICERICAEHDLPVAAITPIIEQTFLRAKQSTASMSQTGPAIRRDEHTIAQQMTLLESHPAWQQIYSAMTASIQGGK
jgi:predicted short-subunit dehydrogenase-like oxidoreductase (DUF2520 family)